MTKKCTVPMGATTDVTGNFHYTFCGKDAKYKVEDWCLCENHKKYLADVEKWPVEPLEKEAK
jgi:hypothetical protein